LRVTRYKENPIVVPGLYQWRGITEVNPAVIYDNGRFYMYERTAGNLRPSRCFIGLLESNDGIHFTHMQDRPVLTGEMLGFPYGSLQDPRIVKIDGLRLCATIKVATNISYRISISNSRYVS
jgi:predicted GH43/DUF377 family glycosyl hydrolase